MEINDDTNGHDVIILKLTKLQLYELIRLAVHAALDNHAPSPSDDLMTREETAKYLHVSFPTLNKWEKKKILVPFRLGGRVYYYRSDCSSQKERLLKIPA